MQLGDMHGRYTCSSLLQSVAQSSVMLPKHWESNEAESVYGSQKSHTPTTDPTPACGFLTSESRKCASHTQLDFLSLSFLCVGTRWCACINKDLKSSDSCINNYEFMFCDLFRFIYLLPISSCFCCKCRMHFQCSALSSAPEHFVTTKPTINL